MGSWFSKNEENTLNDSSRHTNGTVNNNIVISDVKDVVDMHNTEIIILLYIICAIQIIKCVINVWQKIRNNMKRKYLGRSTISLAKIPRNLATHSDV